MSVSCNAICYWKRIILQNEPAIETELFFTKDPRSNFHFFVQARNGKIFLPTRTREPSLLVRVPSARVGRPHPRLLQGEPKQLCVPKLGLTGSDSEITLNLTELGKVAHFFSYFLVSIFGEDASFSL